MLQDMVHPLEQLPECSSSPIVNFDDEELFTEALLACEASTSSAGLNCAAATGTDNFYSYDTTADAIFSPFTSMDSASPSAVLNIPLHNSETNIKPISDKYSSVSPIFPATLPYVGDQQQDQCDQIIPTDTVVDEYSSYSQDSIQQLPVFNQSLAPGLGAYMGLESASPCAFLDINTSAFYSTAILAPSCSFEGPVYFASGMAGMDAQDLAEYQKVDNSRIETYMSEIQPVYCSGDIQVIGDNQNHLINSTCSSSSSSSTTATPLPITDVSVVDDPNLKVGRLTVEERKEKIDRYMKKRNERNFSKKIKYACRKTLADSRPRVRGRFVKNEESGEAVRPISRNHECDDDEEAVMKEDEDSHDYSDILSHISGVNSFNYNYSLESWI